ncbi:CubicO group peptidase (beta-lactamase class C family) [Kribbella voronezhensis]|uniref:CubicO group peptidase (Beta-lactamase class C family) n=1 Tax=Kribbella voronezhensis TaxID=2512212 RepID=A0A4R7T6H0_9ACTN|nr:serine hydrolase domain-containing protein [Kribbella voronezhensis]TDU87411.1 CubicO group peptidase (beta-lactamase class C family) [Kribbella voronezhensis]
MPDWTARLSRLATDHAVPGAVLGLWVDGKETITPYGVLNRATGVEVTADSLFQIGSISKSWTTTMIVQLAAEGRLSLDDQVLQLLPEASIDERITVRHLLTHTSGLDGDVFTDTGRGDDCVAKYVALLADVDQLFEPGTAYSYCNAGFVLLGRIIEVLDDRSWDESLHARITTPLDLHSTVTLPEEAILRRAAVGHLADGTPVSTWQLPRSLGPAGLITASASDVLRFARLHLEDPAYAAMREHQVEYPAGSDISHVGLTWRLYDWSGHQLFGHDGSTISQLAYLRIHPEARVAMVLLTNSANGNALFEAVATEVFTQYADVAPPPAPEPVDALLPTDAILGSYERAGIRIDTTREGDRLLLTENATGARLAFAEKPVVEHELHPTTPLDGNHYVYRTAPDQPWTPVTFTPTHLFAWGRVTPRV